MYQILGPKYLLLMTNILCKIVVIRLNVMVNRNKFMQTTSKDGCRVQTMSVSQLVSQYNIIIIISTSDDRQHEEGAGIDGRTPLVWWIS